MSDKSGDSAPELRHTDDMNDDVLRGIAEDDASGALHAYDGPEIDFGSRRACETDAEPCSAVIALQCERDLLQFTSYGYRTLIAMAIEELEQQRPEEALATLRRFT